MRVHPLAALAPTALFPAASDLGGRPAHPPSTAGAADAADEARAALLGVYKALLPPAAAATPAGSLLRCRALLSLSWLCGAADGARAATAAGLVPLLVADATRSSPDRTPLSRDECGRLLAAAELTVSELAATRRPPAEAPCLFAHRAASTPPEIAADPPEIVPSLGLGARRGGVAAGSAGRAAGGAAAGGWRLPRLRARAGAALLFGCLTSGQSRATFGLLSRPGGSLARWPLAVSAAPASVGRLWRGGRVGGGGRAGGGGGEGRLLARKREVQRRHAGKLRAGGAGELRFNVVGDAQRQEQWQRQGGERAPLLAGRGGRGLRAPRRRDGVLHPRRRRPAPPRRRPAVAAGRRRRAPLLSAAAAAAAAADAAARAVIAARGCVRPPTAGWWWVSSVAGHATRWEAAYALSQNVAELGIDASPAVCHKATLHASARLLSPPLASSRLRSAPLASSRLRSAPLGSCRLLPAPLGIDASR